MELYFNKEAVDLPQKEYDELLAELTMIVAGMPDLPYDKLKDFSSVASSFMLTIEGDDQTHKDLRDILKVASANFIYTMQLTTTLVEAMRELDVYKKGGVPSNDSKIILQ